MATARVIQIAAFAGALGVASAPTPAQRQFRAGVDLVNLPVTVTSKGGDPLRGLTRDDFIVLEDGKPQQIALFFEGKTDERVALHLGLCLDTSESMSSDLKTEGDAAIKFINTLDEAHDVTYVDFDDEVRVGKFEPPSYLQLFERIHHRKATGNTALYDAVGLYLQNTLERGGQHVLLLHTDGADTTSVLTYDKLREVLRRTNVMVYTFGYLDNLPTSERIMSQSRLADIAHDTGGESFLPSSAKDIPKIFDKILAELNARYTVGYVSTNAAADGRFRKIEIKLANPDASKGAKVRTRPGYYAPKQ
jgi:Ca-activated chloride channel family protein